MPIGNAFTILKSVKVEVPYVEEFITNINQPEDILMYNNELYVLYTSGGKDIAKIDINKNITFFAELKLPVNDIENITEAPIYATRMDIDTFGNFYVTNNLITVNPPALGAYYFNICKINSLGEVSIHIDSNVNAGLGIALDKNNNIFYGNITYQKIDKFNINGTLLDSQFGNKSLNRVYDIDFDSKGDLYAASLDKKIYKIKEDASSVTSFVVTTNVPSCLCFDKNDNLYYNESNIIYKVTPSGVKTRIAGNGVIGGDKIGAALNALFLNVNSLLYVEEGSQEVIYICDTGNNKIKKLFLV
jgi:hypothetical protein